MLGTLDRARALHLEGRLVEAEALYRSVLQWQPDTIPAIRGLGVLAYQIGRLDEAVAFFTRGVTIRPNEADFHANLAETLRITKRPDLAFKHILKALALDHTSPDAYNTLGLLEHGREEYAQAEAAFTTAIQLRPKFAAAYLNKGVTLSKLGRMNEALSAIETALELEPKNPAALTNLAQLFLETSDLQQLDRAESLLRESLALDPKCTQTINSLGNALRLKGRPDEAIHCYLHALQINPSSAMPCHNLGKLYEQFGRYKEAAGWYDRAHSIQNDAGRYYSNHGSLLAAREQFDESARCYRLALSHAPRLTEAYQGLGECLTELGQPVEAEKCFQEASQIAPASPFPWIGLAKLYAEVGDLERSCNAAREALTRRANLADSYIRLACNLKGRLPDEDLGAMKRILDCAYLTDETRSQLLFMIAGVLDDRANYGEAAAMLESANALQASARAAKGRFEEPQIYTRFIDRMIRVFDPELLARGTGWGDPDSRPVFVVGLPRSGTTLVEQILASHPKVFGAGELPNVRGIFRSLPSILRLTSDDAFHAVMTLNPSAAREAARCYGNRLDEIAPSTALRVVDKMPDNIDFLGLIALLWPGARVIVCHRDFKDVALSCWQTGFASVSWANKHHHIAQRFADYKRILDHWKKTRPLEWLDVSYEDLVRDCEPQSRRLIEFLGLEWDSACTQFYRTRRTVKSASQIQVRSPVHSRSIARWKHYQQRLQPLFDAIDRSVVGTH